MKKDHNRLTFDTTAAIVTVVSIIFFVWQVGLVLNQTQKLGGFHYFVGSRDFRAYYTAGKMFQNGIRRDFYTVETQFQTQRQFVPELKDPKKFMPFINPPFVVLPVVLVSFLPFTTAYLCWLVLGIAILVYFSRLALSLLAGASQTVKLYALFFSITFLPAVNAILQGQPSILLAIALLASFINFRSNKGRTAGIWLSLLLIRPQYLPLPTIILIGHRRFKALQGLVAGIAGLTIISWFLVGSSGLQGYRTFVSMVPMWAEQDIFTVHPQSMHTFKGFLHLAFGTNYTEDIVAFWLFGIAVALIVLLLIWVKPWRVKSPQFYLQWASMIVCMLFVSPHANFHDVTLLLVAGLLLLKFALIQPTLASKKFIVGFLVAGWFTMLVTLPVADRFGVQLSVVYMVVFLCLSFAPLYWRKSKNKLAVKPTHPAVSTV